ncbi:hypothetical protein [Persicobacter psychrovividus]|uniref:Nuclear transport factor 2 family protein n=1 Tax=Persicobacter psychrovividus TaxID=387638 RepID=A0ABM7VKI4_9BACT|nr:hypothetical protein PEPS_36550 [Persicobacter psychrovividus]BDD01467.1 hypothetical protein PEPS_37470 [Persicobacter psychrovividus]
MRIKSYILVITLLLVNTAFGQVREKVSEAEIKEIIELAIELSELQQYFHIDIDSTRVPLIIKEFGTVNSKNLNGLQKFGQQVQVMDELTIKEKKINAYLNIGDWTYGGDNLRLQMDYPVEGITINMRLNRINGHWKIVDSLIIEE